MGYKEDIEAAQAKAMAEAAAVAKREAERLNRQKTAISDLLKHFEIEQLTRAGLVLQVKETAIEITGGFNGSIFIEAFVEPPIYKGTFSEVRSNGRPIGHEYPLGTIRDVHDFIVKCCIR